MRRLLQWMFVTVLAATLAAASQGATTPLQSKAQKTQKPARDPASVQPAIGTAAIAGTLVALDTGKPLRRAQVRLTCPDPRVVRNMVTDLEGTFTFSELPAGAFTLTASQPGYLDVTYGQKRPGAGGMGTTIRLADRQRLDTITIRLPRGGVLTGTVFDDYGDPAFGVQVRALRSVMRAGERVIEPAGAGRTDDRGIYRIPALPPGDYIVSATPGESANAAADKPKTKAPTEPAGAALTPPDDYAPVFYPGTTLASEATTIALDVSEERAGVDLSLRLVPMARIDGSVSAPDGPLPAGVQVQRLDTGAPQPGRGVRTATTLANGRFSFSALPPGRYTLIARVVLPAAGTANLSARAQAKAVAPSAAKKAARTGAEVQALWAIADVTIDGRNLSDIALLLQPGKTVTGRVAFQGAKPAGDLSRLRVTLEPAERSTAAGLATAPPAPVTADGQFTITGVIPGQYHVRMAGTAGLTGWTLASATVAGRDALDFGLDVPQHNNVQDLVLTLSNRQTRLSGALQNASGQPTDDYYVIVFASDAAYWTPGSRRIQATRPGTDGQYAFRGLPPGDYWVTALVDIEPGAWFDPSLLRQFAGASIAISLREGEQKIQALRVHR